MHVEQAILTWEEMLKNRPHPCKIQEVIIFDRRGSSIFPDVVALNIDFTGRCNLRYQTQYDDGYVFRTSVWDREDGKIDSYSDIIKEALRNGLNPGFK